MKQELELKKIEIQEKGLNKISSYFDLSTQKLGNLDPETLRHLYNMARLGMQCSIFFFILVENLTLPHQTSPDLT